MEIRLGLLQPIIKEARLNIREIITDFPNVTKSDMPISRILYDAEAPSLSFI